MNQKAKKKWIEALRSGKYKQGKRLLRSLNDEFCCLGVACEVFAPETAVQFSSRWEYDGSDALLPQIVQDILGLRYSDGYFEDCGPSLTTMNDRGDTFAEIAYFLESK